MAANNIDVNEEVLYFDEGLDLILDEIIDDVFLRGAAVHDVLQEELVSIEFPASDYEQPISIRGPENNASNIPPPPPPKKTVGEKRCDSVPTHSQQGTGVIASTRPVSGRGEKRLREVYGEQAVPLPTQYNGDGDDAIPSTSGCGRKRLREVYGSDRPLPKEGCLSTLEDIDQDYDERGLTLYVESQEEACNNFDSDSSSDEDDTGPQLSYSMMNKINRNFKRILNLACLPLSYQEVEEIVRSSQTDVISILQNIIACQQQHTIALSHAADFWMNAHNQLLDENRQLQNTLSERYIDSFSFLPMGLSKTTSAFDLNIGEKGFFPHHFNRPENVNYVGPYPSKHFYGYNTMREEYSYY
ncbi:uncharacterized protein LOC125262163 [Megalobrama amblycephala]|uniref:uncharacterized protein LOC125262163 n=1 Tax=Megalobrama amblycephala TaxID=75352 RepID=UPI002013DA3C|nr:uncharacterized protein LOC125262163 [Megalobrama amblycephala]